MAFFYGDALDMTGSSKESTTPSWEFYDMNKDPKEDHNAYNDPAYAATIKEMKIELLEQRKESGDTDANRPKMKEIMDAYWD